MKNKFYLTVLAYFWLSIFMLPNLAHAQDGIYRVVAIADGDTVTLEPVDGGNRIRVRLYGIDCPETNQPYGAIAKAFVNVTAEFQTVRYYERDTDKYGRSVGIIQLSDNQILQEMLLAEGLAWVYTRYCKNCSNWKRIEQKARQQRKGLWYSQDSIPPWKWRKMYRKGS